MSLYDKASIALIPSGTKSGTLYSVLPANGDGDFTHSRSLTTATRTNKDGLIESVAADVPRLDYPITNGVVGDCPHLLLEPSRTNLQIRSEEFDNSAWGKSGSTVTANQVVSPDGSQTADKINDSGSGTGVVQVFDSVSSLSSGSTYTFSVFAKKGTIDYIALRNENFTTPNNSTSYFNISNGTLGTVDVDHTAKIENFGNGWYRCSITFTISTDTSGNLVIRANEADNTPNVVRNGTKNVYLWGAMFEQGSYQTSYIKTTSGQVTRSADVCNNAGTSADFNDSEGVLFVETEQFVDGDFTSVYITLNNSSDSGFTNALVIQHRNNGQLRIYANGSGTSDIQFLENIDLKQNLKIAVQYKQNDYKLYINGTEYSIYSSGGSQPALSGLDNIDFNLEGFTNSEWLGKVKQLIVFNEALSDSELATLTS